MNKTSWTYCVKNRLIWIQNPDFLFPPHVVSLFAEAIQHFAAYNLIDLRCTRQTKRSPVQQGQDAVNLQSGMRIRFWPKIRIRGSVPQTKGDV